MNTLSKLLYIDVSALRRTLSIDIRKILFIKKEKLAYALFYAAMVLSYFASMYVWFFWSIKNLYPILASVLLLVSMLISNSMQHPIYNNRNFQVPLLFLALILFYMNIVHVPSAIGIVLVFFKLYIFFALFRIDPQCYARLATVLCKSLACLLSVSLPMFVLYLLGFNLPNRNAEFSDWYYFTNYYFFLVSDYVLSELIPRFHSVFLEPGHMGTAIVLLLATQLGKWKKWYNIVLIVALLASFSLAAYGLMTILVFLNMWIHRRNILPRIVATVAVIAIVVGSSFVYRSGDNMLNQLIVMRLQLNEAGDDIEGNNRVSGAFETEFDSFIQSSDVFFGRTVDSSLMGGNAGYRVYIYTYGFVGLLLCILAYVMSMRKAPDKRILLSMLFLSAVNFWIRAYPFWYGFFIPCYLFAFLPRQTGNITPHIDKP